MANLTAYDMKQAFQDRRVRATHGSGNIKVNPGLSYSVGANPNYSDPRTGGKSPTGGSIKASQNIKGGLGWGEAFGPTVKPTATSQQGKVLTSEERNAQRSKLGLPPIAPSASVTASVNTATEAKRDATILKKRAGQEKHTAYLADQARQKKEGFDLPTPPMMNTSRERPFYQLNKPAHRSFTNTYAKKFSGMKKPSGTSPRPRASFGRPSQGLSRDPAFLRTQLFNLGF